MLLVPRVLPPSHHIVIFTRAYAHGCIKLSLISASCRFRSKIPPTKYDRLSTNSHKQARPRDPPPSNTQTRGASTTPSCFHPNTSRSQDADSCSACHVRLPQKSKKTDNPPTSPRCQSPRHPRLTKWEIKPSSAFPPHSHEQQPPKSYCPTTSDLRSRPPGRLVHSDMTMMGWSLLPDSRPVGGPTERKFEWFSLVEMPGAAFSLPLPPPARALDGVEMPGLG